MLRMTPGGRRGFVQQAHVCPGITSYPAFKPDRRKGVDKHGAACIITLSSGDSTPRFRTHGGGMNDIAECRLPIDKENSNSIGNPKSEIGNDTTEGREDHAH